jgi:hypothetical protein
MGVKKKEEKKQEDLIDFSNLPPCKTIIISFNWHPYVTGLIKFIKITDNRLISREDLVLLVKEKGLESTPATLASACRSKIEEYQIPIRKEKKDNPKKEEVEKFDLIIILKGYPTTHEEAIELDLTESLIDICIYIRPTINHINNHYKQKLETYNQKLLELNNANADSNTLLHPVVPDLHPQVLHTLNRFSIEKVKYKNFFIRIKEFQGNEDLEFKEEIKDEKEEQKKKDLKPSPKKGGEEVNEEELDLNDPKIKFCGGFVEDLKYLVNQRTFYENWVKTVKLYPLFPESSKFNISLPDSQVLGTMPEKQFNEKPAKSIDDFPKTWDFLYYYACINSIPEQLCDSRLVLACALRWMSRDSLSSSLFIQELKPVTPINIISQNNQILQKTGDFTFYISENKIHEAILKLIKNFNIPGINRYTMPYPTSESKRNAETTELLAFSSFPFTIFERALNIFSFEKLLKKYNSERTWNFGNRNYEEKFELDEFYQIYMKMIEFDPEVVTEYIPRTDSLLLCAYFKTPPGRIIRKAQKFPWRVCPNFSQYLTVFTDKDTREFYDIDPSKVGLIKEKCKIMYPADNSVIKMIEYNIGTPNSNYNENLLKSRYRPIVFKDGWYFGIRKHHKNEFWANFYNEKILAEMGENGLELNFTLDTGLIVKIFPQGEILQEKPGTEEENRIIFTNGSIANYYKDGSITIYMPTGEISHLNKDKLLIITNNKGKRVAKRQKLAYQMESIKITSLIDAETLAKVTIREDLAMTLKFQDNSFAVFHADGTRIYTSSDKNTIFIESPGYSPVRLVKDPIKARQNTVIGLGSSDSGLGAEDIMLRSNDGILIETILPNHTKIQSFVQKQELEAYNQFAVNRINLVIRKDGTVLKTAQDGEIVFITTEAREALAKNSEPNAYFYDIFTLPEERNSGVYTVRVDTGRLWTKDNEGNYFEVTTEGKAIEKLSVSLNIEDEHPESPSISEGEYIDPECKFLPPPNTIISPRLFIIKDNIATELLEESQLLYHFNNTKGQYVKENTPEFVSHTWITDTNPNHDFHFPESPFINYSLPKLVSPMLQTLVLSDTPKPCAYIYRTIKEFDIIDPEKRDKIQINLDKYYNWKANKATEKENQIIIDPRNENEKGKYDSFLQRLSKMRGEDENKSKIQQEDKESVFYVEITDDENVA